MALNLIALLLVGGVVIVGSVVLIDAFIRKPRYAVHALLGAYVATIILDRTLQVTFGSLTISLFDAVSVLLVSATVARLLRRPGHTLGRSIMLTVILGGLVMLSLVRGIPEHGLQSSVNAFREWFHYLAAILYFSTVPFTREFEQRCLRALTWSAVLLCVLTVGRWQSKLGGIPLGPFDLGSRAATRFYGEGESLRVIHANDTFLILQVAFIYVLRIREQMDRRMLRFAGVLMFFPLAMQHRTVWIAMLVGLGLIFAEDREIAGRVAVFATVVLTLAVGGLLITAGADGLSRTAEHGNQTTVELGDGALAGNTFVWRFEGWVALLKQVDYSDPIDPVVGAPFGSGYERRIRGSTVSVSPHSGYVTAFLRMGAVGLALFIGTLVGTVLSLRRRGAHREWLSDRVLAVLLICQAVFLITYDPDLVHGMVLGLGMGSLAARPRHGDAPRRMDAPSGITAEAGLVHRPLAEDP